MLLSLNVVLSQISAGPYFKTEPERSSAIVFVLSSHPVDVGEEKGGQRISKSSLSSFLQGIHFWRNTDTELPLPCWQIRPANKEGNETNYFLSGSQAALCEEAAGCTTLTVTQKHTWDLPGLHTSTLLCGAFILRHLPTPEPPAARISRNWSPATDYRSSVSGSRKETDIHRKHINKSTLQILQKQERKEERREERTKGRRQKIKDIGRVGKMNRKCSEEEEVRKVFR